MWPCRELSKQSKLAYNESEPLLYYSEDDGYEEDEEDEFADGSEVEIECNDASLEAE